MGKGQRLGPLVLLLWRNHTGQVIASVSYEADMTDAAGACLRLWFCTRDPKTGDRHVTDQNVRMAPTPDGKQWQFEVGRQVSS
jgi:hypothetical protein